MKMKIREIKTRRATKNHICDYCASSIFANTEYVCITVKIDPDKVKDQFESIKLHEICVSDYFRNNDWIFSDSKVSLYTTAFESFLNATQEFYDKWQISLNNIENRKEIITEEIGEFVTAVNDNSNIEEEAGDVIAAAFGNLLWARDNYDKNISIYGALTLLTEKLRNRNKFGYLLWNPSKKISKATHWQKALYKLKNERDQWKVLKGPKYIHPEIRELLTESEILKLEKAEA